MSATLKEKNHEMPTEKVVQKVEKDEKYEGIVASSCEKTVW